PPPRRPRSTGATRAPRATAIAVVTSPAVPPPITTRWYRSEGRGFTHPAGWTFCASRRLNASHGSSASWGATSPPSCSVAGFIGFRFGADRPLRDPGDPDGHHRGGDQPESEKGIIPRPSGDVRPRGDRCEAARHSTGVDVEQGPGEHTDRRRDVIAEADARQTQRVVEEVVGEDGRES